MREIKFRAWDKSSNTRVNTDTYGITFSGKTLSYVNGEGYCADGDEFIIEQFIGLLDKNGKEIYEGDILANNDERGNQPVEYDTEVGGYCTDDLMINGTTVVEFELEVIGNIHESPELLQ